MTNVTSFISTLWRTDARLATVGLLMLCLLGANGLALALDPREIAGAPGWLKPAKFAASVGIFTLSLAWVFSYLPDWTRTRRLVSWITSVTLLLEIVIINLQVWRGTTSHFNVGTLVDGLLFSIMGTAILVQTCATVAVAVALWRQNFADRAMGWTLRLGISLSLVGAMTGGLMTRPTPAQLADARAGHRMTIAGAHSVGGPDGGPGLPGTGWSREHGDMRVAHFLGLHALQGLPLLAFAFARRGWHEARRVRLVWILSTSYAGLYSLLLWQALRGQSVTTPDATTLMAMSSWAALTVVAIGLATTRSRSSRVRAVVL
jgi:hypothetical protein